MTSKEALTYLSGTREAYLIVERDLEMFEIIKKYYDIELINLGLRIIAKKSFPLGMLSGKELEIIMEWLGNEQNKTN